MSDELHGLVMLPLLTHTHTHAYTCTRTHACITHSLEEEWEYKNRERLINTVLHANRLVQEANMLADELNKDTVFKVTLTVSNSM